MPRASQRGLTMSTKSLLRELRDHRVSRSAISAQVNSFFTSLDTALSLSCYILYNAGEFEQLVSKDINPLDYNEADKFSDDLAAISFLRKSRFLKTGINLKEVALNSFEAAEEQCRETNRNFRSLGLNPNYKGSNVWLLHAVTQKIQKILEPIGLGWYKELIDAGAFGPGSSTSIRGNDTSSERKFNSELHITSNLYRVFWKRRRRLYPLWFTRANTAEQPILQDFSRVVTVPKNAKTDRTIAIEPGLNIWFQKGLGTMIRRRLRRVGYNLNSDLKNQRSAYRGSIDGQIATVDMKAASDTIAKRMVEEILPPDWFNALDTCRSHRFELGNDVRTFEKFSSMGNGFTFELESLIFVTAAAAVCDYLKLDDSDVSIFGDDVTLPSSAVTLFTDFCKFLGFTVNTQKSFSTGYFRESCGSFYFNGKDVKPIFLKENPSNVERVYNFANSVRHLAHRRAYRAGCDARLQLCHQMIVHSLPSRLRLKGDVNGGTGCIHSNFDEAVPRMLKDGHEGFSFMSLIRVPKTASTDHSGLLVARVRASLEISYGNSYPLRAETNLRYKALRTSQWYDFGPWF